MIKEEFTAIKAMQGMSSQAGGSGYGKVVDDLLSTMKGMTFEDAKANFVQYQSKNPVAMRAEMKQVVADGVAAAATLPDGDGYKRWILFIARKVSQTRTDGFLGIGARKNGL